MEEDGEERQEMEDRHFIDGEQKSSWLISSMKISNEYFNGSKSALYLKSILLRHVSKIKKRTFLTVYDDNIFTND